MSRELVFFALLAASCADQIPPGSIGWECPNDDNCLPDLACIGGKCAVPPADAGPRRDAAVEDAGLADADVDAGEPDAELVDTGPLCPVPPELAEIQSQIFGANGQPDCNEAACHGQSAAGGIQLTLPLAQLRQALLGDTLDPAAPQRKLVVPGDPAQSRLYVILANRAPGGNGGPMPPGAPLDACDAETVRGWIEAGAP